MTYEEVQSLLLYGKTGSGKTTQAALLAKYVAEKLGKKTRLIRGDPGGGKQFKDLGLIDAGWVETFQFSKSEHPIAHLFRLSNGYWPRVNKAGKLEFGADDKFRTTDTEWNDIGCYIIDSLSGLGDILLDHVSNPDVDSGFKLGTSAEEDGYSYGSLAMGHYNIVYKQLYKAFVRGFCTLPIRYLIVTAREAVVEENKFSTSYGPSAAGPKLDSKIPGWFMDMYHLSTEVVQGTDSKGHETEYLAKCAWYQDHNDNNSGLPYVAKYRLAGGMHLVEKKFPAGYIELDEDKGLVEFLRFLELIASKLSKVAPISVKPMGSNSSVNPKVKVE